MRVSIIVITRNRANFIGEAFAAITGQAYPDFETIVVDSSTGADREKTEQLARQYGIKYVAEPRRGQSLARNLGTAKATGEIIAFTDDDCVPAKDWLTQTIKNFSDPAVWVCTGRVVQYSRNDAADLFEEVAGQDLGGERRVFGPEDIRFSPGFVLANVTKIFAKHLKSAAPVPFGIGHGSSMAFRRVALEKLGGFDERFGGESIIQYAIEDIELFYRALKSGHKIVYEPAAVVRHKHKLSAEEVFKTRYIYSYTGAALLWEHRNAPKMLFMFCGRWVQLIIKSAQYKILGNRELARSFGSDLRGFLDGWAAYRKFARTNRLKPGGRPIVP
jgi:GT2 family glycosyltransferase